MSVALRALLAGSEYVSADCWTLTLNGGSVIRWTSADIPIFANGNIFAKGPTIKRFPISEKRGVDVATLSVQITATGGSVEIENGTFDTDTRGWTPSANATLSNNLGTLRVTKDSAGTAYAYQSIPVVAGSSYTVKWDNLGGTSGTTNRRFYIGTTPGASDIAASTTVAVGQSVTFVAPSAPIYLSCVTNSTAADGTYSDFDNISIINSFGDLINGQPIIPFIRNHGLDGASVKLERAFAPDFDSPVVGTIIRFAGKVTSINSIQGAIADLTISSWMVLLNVNMPRNLYQSACLHTVYDAGCTLNPASFSSSGTVSGSAGATVSFASSLTPALNDYALGRIVFTSGANTGISRTIRSNDTAGNFTLIQPLPNGLASGDAFTVYAGCDLTTARCTTKFNNLVNFKGTPFVPLPQTPLGSQSKTTTSSGKG